MKRTILGLLALYALGAGCSREDLEGLSYAANPNSAINSSIFTQEAVVEAEPEPEVRYGEAQDMLIGKPVSFKDLDTREGYLLKYYGRTAKESLTLAPFNPYDRFDRPIPYHFPTNNTSLRFYDARFEKERELELLKIEDNLIKVRPIHRRKK